MRLITAGHDFVESFTIFGSKNTYLDFPFILYVCIIFGQETLVYGINEQASTNKIRTVVISFIFLEKLTYTANNLKNVDNAFDGKLLLIKIWIYWNVSQ